MKPTVDFARYYAACGYSPIPIRPDGSKKPIGLWEKAMGAISSPAQITEMFRPGVGIALVQGAVSGGRPGLTAEVLEVESEEVYERLREQLVERHQDIAEYLNLVVKSGGGGIHLYYRHDGTPEGNKGLAATAAEIPGHKPDKQGFTTIIETRGEGGYVLAPGGPDRVHKTGNPYRLLSGSFKHVPELTARERGYLFGVCRLLDERPEKPAYTPSERPQQPRPTTGGVLPGEDFDNRGADVALTCLLRHGWQVGSEQPDHLELVRPGKDKREGTGGTFGKAAPGVLHVFSSNAAPFDGDGNYGPFKIVALLDFGGDYSACAASLAQQGYGSPRERNKPSATSAQKPQNAPTPKRIFTPDVYAPREVPKRERPQAVVPVVAWEDEPTKEPQIVSVKEIGWWADTDLPEPELEFEAEPEKPAPPVQKAPVATNPELESLRKLGAEAEAAMLEQAEAEFWAGWRELSLLLDALPRMTWQKSPGVFVSDVANWVHLALERCRSRKRLHGGPEWIEHRAGLDLCAGFDQLYQNLDSLKWWTPETT